MTKKISTSRKLYRNASHMVRFLVRGSIALTALGWAAANAYCGIDSLAWPTVEGQFLDGSGPGAMTYEYVVKNNRHVSSRVRFGDLPFVGSDKEFLQHWSIGSRLLVRYNPDLPGLSTLLPDYDKLGVYIPLGIGAFFFVTAGAELRSRYLVR
ncbi:MAG: DUF3592 domain-containing protein [Candidatus Obscuribacterales bacterium]|nr:DUF3592 domain-containing protein [Candidatus Obscuribacterales bacterium]